MRLIDPIAITPEMVAETTVTAALDGPEWAAGTTYAAGERVVIEADRAVYQSVANENTGHDPRTDDGTWWLRASTTAPWRPFDQRAGTVVRKTDGGQIVYRIVAPTLLRAIGALRLSAATMRVVVRAGAEDGPVTYDSGPITLVDGSDYTDYLSMVLIPPRVEDTLILDNIGGLTGAGDAFVALTGDHITIEIGDGGGQPEVGEIILGTPILIGETLDGTEIGLEDYSGKTRDDWGGVDIIERGYNDRTRFLLALRTGDARRIRRVLGSLRAKPVLYYDDDLTFGTTVYGLYADFSTPLSASGVSYCTLDVEGL